MIEKTVVLDFETFYSAEYTLRGQKGLSYPEFILDDRFKAFGAATYDVGTGKAAWVPADKLVKWLKAHRDYTFIFHNGYFDAAILAWRYAFRPKQTIDTLSLANHVLGSRRDTGYGNDLASLATRLGLEAKGRIDFMKGVRDPDEGQMAALISYALGDARLTFQVYEHLLPQLSNAPFELWLIDHTLMIYTQRPLHLDPKKIAETRVKVNERREQLVKDSGVTPELLNSNKQFAVELTKRLKVAKIAVPMKRGKKGMIPALSKGDAAFMALADNKAKAVSVLVRARLVQRSATTILARLNTMESYAKRGLGIPVHLVYYGAHTGRFSGGGGFNFQNLTSPNRAIDELDRLIAVMVRESIVAGTDNVFVADDAAQIEARVLAWLAGEKILLEQFATGQDVYSLFISEAIGEEVRKDTTGETKERAARMKLMRQVGKEAVLGLGYNMGVEKFIVRLRANKEVAKIMDAGQLDVKTCARIVHTYRDKYPNIVGFWSELNNAFQVAIRGGTRRVGRLVIKRSGKGDVAIVLPNGRHLFYRDIRPEMRTGSTTFINADGVRKTIQQDGREWKHGSGQRIYGGLLAENVTQAVARDILAEGIKAAEEAGYPVALHVHDEIVCNVPRKQGPACLAFLDKTLSTPPSWGKGMVLGAEGHIAENLSK